MNKKGFTLIELLSVIVVLGLIFIIVVPRVLNIIKGAKRDNITIPSSVTSIEDYAFYRN